MQNSKIKNVVIAGSGLMGASMAQVFARYGYTVVLYDIAEAALQKAAELISINQKSLVAQGEISQEASDALQKQMTYSTDMNVFAQADFVIEAIIEKIEIKHSFWKDVSKIVPDHAVLTTNTSGLSINEIAKAVKLPARFAGMHWVNPPHIVPLVELISAEETDEATMKAIEMVALSLHRKPITVKGDPKGFVLNRLQYAVLREALHIVESGYASAEDVDNVMKYGLGMRYSGIGPFETVDLGGLDTFFHVGSYLFADLSNATKVPKALADLYHEGSFGTKTGKGFYDYSDGKDKLAIEKRDKAFLKLAKCLFSDL